MPKEGDEAKEKRRKIQVAVWKVVGSAEHINLPKLEDALKKEFHTTDDRVIQTQVQLMQSEARISIKRKNKVWIKQPSSN